MADLDHLLGLLRQETPRSAQPTPAPNLTSLGGLLTAARSAGLTVEQTLSGDLSRLPVLVSQEAYRIVQEGLTNALKYSADGTAMLSMSLQTGTLEIRLTNPARAQRATRTGRGLRGIGERAAALGGTTAARARRPLDALGGAPGGDVAGVNAIQVLLVDDEPLVRSGLRAILVRTGHRRGRRGGRRGSGGFTSTAHASRHRLDGCPDAACNGITATRLLGQFDGGGPAVIVVTTFENDDYVYDALQAGARGFLLKRSAAEDYVNAIRTVHESESLLFPLPSASLSLAAAGKVAEDWPRRT